MTAVSFLTGFATGLLTAAAVIVLALGVVLVAWRRGEL